MDSGDQQRICSGLFERVFLAPMNRSYRILCAFGCSCKVLVGMLGFGFHLAANLKGPSAGMLQDLIDGAPPFASLLFPNLMVLALIALWALDPARSVTNGGRQTAL